MTIEDTLNKFQKRRVLERLKLNFNEELNKSKIDPGKIKFYYSFLNEIDFFVERLYNDGVLFYGFQLYMPFLKKENQKDQWYYTHLRVEDWLNFLKTKVELIEFCYLSIELNNEVKMSHDKNFVLLEPNTPYFSGIIGIRSLLGKNDSHFFELKKVLNVELNYLELKSLNSIDVIKKYWIFVMQNRNFKFHRFAQFSNYYDNYYGSIADLELQYDNKEHIAFALDEHEDSKDISLSGITDLNPDNETIINYLIHIYMFNEKLFLCNNKIYKKLNNFEIKLLGSIFFLQKNNLNIFNDLKIKFPQQLSGLKISKLLHHSWDLFFFNICKCNHYLPTLDTKNYVIIN